jgi:hypothetical protein
MDRLGNVHEDVYELIERCRMATSMAALIMTWLGPTVYSPAVPSPLGLPCVTAQEVFVNKHAQRSETGVSCAHGFRTIQKGLDAAKQFGIPTVVVCGNATYEEAVSIPPGITLISEIGQEICGFHTTSVQAAASGGSDICGFAGQMPRIQPPPGSSAVRITGPGHRQLTGFHIHGVSHTSGPAVFIEDASATINCNVFHFNEAKSGPGGAVFGIRSFGLIDTNCFEWNRTLLKGGGSVYLEQDDDFGFTISNNYFFANFTEKDAGGAVCLIAGRHRVENNVFVGNKTGFGVPPTEVSGKSVRGGAIFLASSTSKPIDVTINSNSFLRNRSFEDGGAIRVQRGGITPALHAKATIESNEFVGNSSEHDDGGALSVNVRGEVTLVKNVFHRNHSRNNGGAVHAGCAATVTIDGGEFTKNQAGGLRVREEVARPMLATHDSLYRVLCSTKTSPETPGDPCGSAESTTPSSGSSAFAMSLG